MKTADIEKVIGRKLKFKEKLALKILSFKNKKTSSEYVSSEEGIRAKRLGTLSLIFFLIWPLSIVLAIKAIIKADKVLKKNPHDDAAKQGKSRGIMSLILFPLVLILALSTFLAEFKINLFAG